MWLLFVVVPQTVRLWSMELEEHLSNLVCYRGHNAAVWDVTTSPHAPYFATRWPTPTFHPTDCDASALRSSDAHASAAGLLGGRIRKATAVDVSRAAWDVGGGVPVLRRRD